MAEGEGEIATQSVQMQHMAIQGCDGKGRDNPPLRAGESSDENVEEEEDDLIIPLKSRGPVEGQGISRAHAGDSLETPPGGKGCTARRPPANWVPPIFEFRNIARYRCDRSAI